MSVMWNGAAVLAAVEVAASAGIAKGATEVEREAISLIMSGPKTGRVYDWVGTTKNDPERAFLITAPQGHKFWAKLRPTAHQASAPGQAPANDFGMLVSQIAMNAAGLSATVSVSGDVAKYLEYGTRFMEPRPFMRPALVNKRDAVRQDIAEEIGKALR